MKNVQALEPPRQPTLLRRWSRNLSSDIVSGAGAIIVVLVLVLGLVGPFVIPYGSEDLNPTVRLSGPSLSHPFGTDQFGRDILSRIASGARISLLVGAGGTLLALAVGLLLGAVAAFVGGWLDDVVMRVMDVLMAFPYIVLAIALAWVVGPSLSTLILVIGIIRVPQIARITRGAVLTVREREFVEAARSIGQMPATILVKHVLPNALSPVVVYATLAVATAINTEAALSFLGLGIQPPTASWGTMLADGRKFLFDAPWIATFPGLIISLTILGLNMLGDSLRDAMDPMMRGRGGSE